MKQIDLSKVNGTMKKQIEKAAILQHYRTFMRKSFRENIKLIREAGVEELRKSFLETGKGCKDITAEEYANLAVETYNEVMKSE